MLLVPCEVVVEGGARVPRVRLRRCGGANVSCAVTSPLRSSGRLYVGPGSARRAVLNRRLNRRFGRDAAVWELARGGDVEWGAWAPVG